MASNLRVDTILPSSGTTLGIGTASGTINFLGNSNLTTTGDVTVGGNLGVGGTLTYEDVTNVDSVGVITARSGIDCNGNATFGANGSITSSANFVLSSNRLRVTGSDTVGIECQRASNATIQCTETTNNTDLQLRANSDGGLVRTATNKPLIFGTNQVERMRLTGNGEFLFLKTSFDQQAKGMSIENHARVMFTNDNIIAFFTRTGSDGQMIRFYGDTTSEGSINISGTSISYNGGVLSRWSQIVGISTNNKADRPTIYQGTVMSNLDEMCEWGDEENMQLNKTQVSNVSGDKNVAGVFWAWDDDDDTYLNDYYVAQTGDYIIRVGASTTVTRGDLLESAGDGTAKPQSDDIVRSKTIAKVTSGIAHTTYPDGTKTYPCVLMAS